MIDEVMKWLGLASLLISIGTVLWSGLSSGEKAVATDLAKFKEHQGKHDEEVDDAIVGLAARVQSLESEMKHLPDKDSVVDLKLAMAELKGTVGRLDESLGSVQRTVLRIDDWLRQERK